MSGLRTMSGIEKRRGVSVLLTPLPAHAIFPPLDGKTGKIRVRPLCRQPSWRMVRRTGNIF
jgi:hypothetical protein